MSSELFRNLSTPEILDTRTFSEMLADVKSEFDEILAAQLALGRITQDDIDAFDVAAVTEGDPIWMVLQAGAYSKLKDAKLTNDTYLQTLVPFATGNNLDVLAANFAVSRHENESDERFRHRTCLQWALLEKGTHRYYQKLCLDADPTVKDAKTVNPGPRSELTLANTVFSTSSPGTRHFAIQAVSTDTTGYELENTYIFKNYTTQAEFDADTTEDSFFAILTIASEEFLTFNNIGTADAETLEDLAQIGDILSIGENRYSVAAAYVTADAKIKIDDTAYMQTNISLTDAQTYTTILNVRKKYLKWNIEDAGDASNLAKIVPGDKITLENTADANDTKTYTIATTYDSSEKRFRIDDDASEVSDLTDAATYSFTTPERHSGNVIVSLQSTGASGGPADGSLILKIFEYITDEQRKIQNDPVQVFSIEPVFFDITAEVEFQVNENTTQRLIDLESETQEWATSEEIIDADIYLSRLYQVLSPSYVRGVTISEPTANFLSNAYQVPVLRDLTLTEIP